MGAHNQRLISEKRSGDTATARHPEGKIQDTNGCAKGLPGKSCEAVRLHRVLGHFILCTHVFNAKYISGTPCVREALVRVRVKVRVLITVRIRVR